jgi:serine/threonine-protein kinase PknG
MEYVHGKTLDQIIEDQGRPFSVSEAIDHMLGILPAFTYLAKLGLVYCDFKPQNIMLEVLKDGTQIVKLIDLGTVIKHEPNPTDVYGTHGFYAPEAVKHPSPETDLYSLCRTLAYLVTQMDLANPIFGMPSSESYQAFRDYPALYRLLAKGTHKDAQRRFHSAEQLSDQLSGVRRQIQGGRPGELVGSKLFVPGILTTTGKLGLRGEAVLEEKDKAIDLLRLGDQALRSGNAARAQNFYRQACQANRQSLDAHLRLAEVLIEQGDFTQALGEVTTAQKLQPGSWKIAWYTGRLLEAQGKLRAAADQYRELISDLPGELPPQQALARTSAKLGDHIQAIQLYTNVLKADPGNTDALLGTTDSLLQQQSWDEATKLLKSVNEAAARFVEAQLLLCDVYLQYMRPLTPQTIEQAAQAVQVLSGKTEDPRYYLARGDVYHAAWHVALKQRWPRGTALAGVTDASPNTLGAAAEKSYKRYLHIGKPGPTEREAILRKKFAVAPWRLW